jgi:hypothetical protein
MTKYLIEKLMALSQLFVSCCRITHPKDNYTTNFRVVNKFGKYIPQHFNGIIWKDIPFENKMWDNYSGRYTFINAKQRLYIYMGSEKKEWGGHSIFETGKIRNATFFDFIVTKKAKEDVLFIYNKYIGKTEFLRNIFPEYFTEAVNGCS